MDSHFESHAKKTENAVEFWLARDLQQLLGYEKWDNFKNIISKAKTACELSDSQIADHFADVGKMVTLGSGRQKLLVSYLTVKLQTISLTLGKMVTLGSGSQRKVEDIMLTRYACYLIAQNGDSRKRD